MLHQLHCPCRTHDMDNLKYIYERPDLEDRIQYTYLDGIPIEYIY
jgi:hypothetical protein